MEAASPVPVSTAPAAPVVTAPAESALQRHWRQLCVRVQYQGLRLICRGLSSIKLSSALNLGQTLGDLAYNLVRRHRLDVLQEMRRCYPGDSMDEARDRLRRVYRHIGMNYVEVFRWIGGQVAELDKRVQLTGGQHLEQARARGKGVLVLTAHMGNWDLMGLWAARRYPLTIISKALRQEGVNRFWMEARAATGLSIVPSRKSYRACLGVLKKQGLLGFMLDQNTLAHEGVFVDFFGKPACTHTGLAFLSSHSEAPVVPVFIYRKLDGTHWVEVQPPVDPPPDREPATLQAATQRYTRIIEDAIRQHPDQWIWMHRRWRTVPPSAEQSAPLAGLQKMEKQP
jgi:KDO2-lipid IV(A) lauroyltransferase